jgi:hypothetical protein
VPVFVRYLGSLRGLVLAAQAQAGEAVLQSCLAHDMLPFATQVQIACNFVLRACFPLAGQSVPACGDFADNFEGLLARIASVQQLAESLEPALFDGADTRTVRDPAGLAVVTLPGQSFLLHYALPNFFFHVTTAYAILRNHGVKLSKEDFDTFHRYA